MQVTEKLSKMSILFNQNTNRQKNWPKLAITVKAYKFYSKTDSFVEHTIHTIYHKTFWKA